MILDYTEKMAEILGPRMGVFEEIIQRDFEMIKPYLPQPMASVLDIGCGLGGIDVMLGQEVDGVELINIIDGDGTGESRSGLHADTKAWADREIAREFISRNVGCYVKAFKPDESLTIPADLIISLKSWGHHYPVDVYMELVKRSLRPGGRIMVDIRKTKDESDKIVENGFEFIDVIYEGQKFLRMVFQG